MTIISIIENTIERTGEIENICGREHSFNSIPAEQPVKTLSDIYQGRRQLIYVIFRFSINLCFW